MEDDSEDGSGGDSDNSSGVAELTAKLPDLDFNISGEAYVLPAKPPLPADPLHRLHTFKAIYGQRVHGEDPADLKRRHDCYVAVRRILDDEVTVRTLPRCLALAVPFTLCYELTRRVFSVPNACCSSPASLLTPSQRIQHSTLADVCSALVKFITEIDVDDPEEDTIPTAILLTGASPATEHGCESASPSCRIQPRRPRVHARRNPRRDREARAAGSRGAAALHDAEEGGEAPGHLVHRTARQGGHAEAVEARQARRVAQRAAQHRAPGPPHGVLRRGAWVGAPSPRLT